MEHCPNCDIEMTRQDDELDVGITGGYYCEHCDHFITDEELVRDDNGR